MGVLAAERIKLVTTRSTGWCTLLAVVVGVGLAALQSGSASSYDPMTPGRAAIGITMVGVPVLMVLATMTVTTEYRTGMVRNTFQACPHRAQVLVAKAVAAGVWVAVVSAVTALASVFVAWVVAGPTASVHLELTGVRAWATIGAVTLYAFFCAVLAVAVGVLLQHAAGAIALLLLWPTVIELMFGWLTDTGKVLQPFLPFVNAIRFTGVPWYTTDGVAFIWNPVGSIFYFAAVVATALGAAVIAIQRRDV